MSGMNLLDHFHPPLSQQRHWHGFHNAWATSIAAALNEQLPEGYFAEPNVQFGIEIDVATFKGNGSYLSSPKSNSTWKAPAPTQTLDLLATTDIVEVAIFHREGGPTLAGAIELVSPANKDRPAHRDAFVQKCATYLRESVGLAVIDIVTSRGASLHAAIVAAATGQDPEVDPELFAAAYRPIERDSKAQLDIWQASLAIGQPLPIAPFWLRGEISLPLDLGQTYERTCRELRLTS
jgi:hypothetical protein